MKFAAVDIGSNASRLLFCNVFEKDKSVIFKKAFLIRVPLRLGEDAFSKKIITEKKIQRLIKTLQAFKLLIDVHEVICYRICATSAMREAANGQDIVKRVRKETGLVIEIVEGKREAEIIYANHIAEEQDPKKSYLYIDVGGGSCEITLFANRKIITSRSFDIGTIRMLQNRVTEEQLSEIKAWVKKTTVGYKPLMAIGSGGNINKLASMWGVKENKAFSFKNITILYNYIKSHTLQERQEELGLNTDRADVIIPAAEIYLMIMKAAGIKKILVPKIGLSDGIVHQLYEAYIRKGTTAKRRNK